MRILVETLGTRGDVQPYMALALALMARGHEVRLSGPAQYGAMVAARGIDFTPLPAEFLALMDTPEGKAAIAGGSGFSSGLKLIGQARPMMRRLLDVEWQGARDFAPDMMLYHPKALGVPHVAEKLGRPALLAVPLPGFTPTAAFPSPLLPFFTLGPLNRASHALATNGASLLFGKQIRQWRAEALGLSPRPTRALPPHGTLYAYSPLVLPVPPDWGADVAVTGYWFLDHGDWRPDPALAAFLASGPVPAYIGFGSMPGLDPVAMTETIVAALRRTGQRAVLATGGGALGGADLPDFVHGLAEAPHDRLFPLVSGVVHHGGAGTTGAALRAGRPMAICPFFGDQPFWARRMQALGVAPAPLDRKTLSPDALAAAMTALANPVLRHRAEDLGQAIRAERGIANAVAFIEARAGH